eukprot:6065004-Pleurochrysis_carterae.AAC.1
MLDRTKSVCGFRVGNPRHRPWRLLAPLRVRSAGVDDGRCSGQLLNSGKGNHPLRRRYPGVDRVDASVAGIGRDSAGLCVVLQHDAPSRRLHHALCRTGGATQPSARSASTAFAAAAACSIRPGWWNARTVISSQSERAFTPPLPACATMSSSGQRNSAAAARSAARSNWRAPGKVVWRVDLATGTHLRGSLQSHTMPRPHRGISFCSITTVGTAGTSTSAPPARARSAAVAASAAANHASTLP